MRLAPIIGICLLFMIESAHGAPPSSLKDILLEVHKNPPFNLSPRYIDFRPSGDLKAAIDDYVKNQDAAHLKELKTELDDTNDAYTALACIFMITHFKKDDVVVCLTDYKALLSRKPDFKFTQDYPSRSAVLDEVDAILAGAQK